MHYYDSLLEHTELPLAQLDATKYRSTQHDLQRRGVSFMQLREREQCHAQYGGLICDELGLGKTFQMLTLIVEQLARHPGQKTLVVASSNVMYEWQKQAERHIAPGVLRVAIYYGADRTLHDPASYDVLLTTYGMVAAEYAPHRNREGLVVEFGTHTRKGRNQEAEPSPFRRNFDRIVLDEAHNIRNSTTQVHRAVCALSGERRWAITGTPIWNDIVDLHALFVFLHASPFDEPHAFHTMAGAIRSGSTNMETLRRFMLPIELRRTKASLGLPELVDRVERVALTEGERLFYTALYDYSRDTIARLLAREKWLRKSGWARMTTNLGARTQQCILSVILRMRQACVHPQLAIDAAACWRNEPFADAEQAALLDDTTVLASAASRLRQLVDSRAEGGADDGMSAEECAVCMTEVPSKAIVPCGHTFCGSCLAILEARGGREYRCPMCRGVIQAFRDVAEVLAEAEAEAEEEQAASNNNNNNNSVVIDRAWDVFSSKIRYMITTLSERLARDPTTKALIFSQWRGVLDMAGKALAEFALPYLRIDGTVTKAATRSSYQERFNSDPSIVAMVCSLNCSSEGINLQGANIVFILDPWFTPARAKQAGNRAHRVGQTRPVEIIHVIAADTIEERVLEMEERKQRVVDGLNGAVNGGWEGRVRSLMDL